VVWAGLASALLAAVEAEATAPAAAQMAKVQARADAQPGSRPPAQAAAPVVVVLTRAALAERGAAPMHAAAVAERGAAEQAAAEQVAELMAQPWAEPSFEAQCSNQPRYAPSSVRADRPPLPPRARRHGEASATPPNVHPCGTMHGQFR